MNTPQVSVARLVHYVGRVQGVGFRATAVQIARRYPVTGWVKNLPDGRVQLFVEGPPAEAEAYLAAIRSYWGDRVENELIEDRSPTGALQGFVVVH